VLRRHALRFRTERFLDDMFGFIRTVMDGTEMRQLPRAA
jgi:hypothetical protein